MIAISNWVADQVWWLCLYVRRLPFRKRCQRRPIGIDADGKAILAKPNRLSLFYGRRILRTIFLLFLVYVCVIIAYVIGTEAQTRGWLSLPQNVQQKVGVEER